MSRLRVAIVGGVAGGATAAARARRLSEDAEIVVYERGPHVSFANCGMAYHIGGEIQERDDLLLQTPESLRKRYNLDVRMRTEVLAVNRQGRIAADNIFGRNCAYRGTQGTSIVRVFDVVVATTGANEKTLREARIEYEKVYIHPDHHVAYFPEAARMTIKLLFATDNGRVLGAQVVGGEGVDKRIDVLAMAVQAGMTVYDLEEVELAYAPQFGSAKDPVNMAGFVAAGVLRGDVRVTHADAMADSVLVDVRRREEHDMGAIPGSVSIPLDELRSRHHELPAYGRLVVYCQVGLRGYVAARLLTQLGYDVRNLSGGFLAYQLYQSARVTSDREQVALTP